MSESSKDDRVILGVLLAGAALYAGIVSWQDVKSQRNWTTGSCNDAAAVAQHRCEVQTDQPCDIYKDVYEACREETKAGKWVQIGKELRYVPPEDWVDE